MNFIEAVAEMRKGNKVKRTSNAHNDIYAFNGIFYMNKSFRQFEMGDFEATDWELLEDEFDWNLADQKDSDEDIYFTDVKKCRDLIIKKNFEKAAGSLFIPLIDVKKIINETFGDL